MKSSQPFAASPGDDVDDRVQFVLARPTCSASARAFVGVVVLAGRASRGVPCAAGTGIGDVS
jgi:hypothetical protein